MMTRRHTLTAVTTAVVASFLVVPMGFAQVAGGFGVGTTTPDAALHVFRDDKTAQVHIQEASTSPGNQTLLLLETAVGAPILRYSSSFGQWDFTGGGLFTINDPADAAIEMKVNKAGNMTISGDYFSASCGPCVADYVFENDYQLMPLAELRTFIAREKHLPNIPSAAEIEEQGVVNVSKMQMRLLEKIEELTLYTLEQQETILEQQKLLADLQARLTAIEKKTPTVSHK